MKNGKKLTLKQKKLLWLNGFKSEQWLAYKNTTDTLYIVHRYTKAIEKVEKKKALK